ncbi:MAG: transglycosylase SLT domain-containing protein [Vicinamibacteria bacterium]
MSVGGPRPRLLGAALALGILGAAGGWMGFDWAPGAQQRDVAPQPAGDNPLGPRAHAPLPSVLWMAPAHDATAAPSSALAGFVRGARLLDEGGDAAVALPLVSHPALSTTAVADYARYYTGLALMALERGADAEVVFAELAGSGLEGHLPEDAALKLAELREHRKDFAGAVAVYETLAARRTSSPATVLARLAAAADAAGDRARAVEAYFDVYYGYPTSALASDADAALTRLKAWDDGRAARFDRDLARADALYTGGRWQAARTAYERLLAQARGDVRSLATIRMAAADFRLRRHRSARTLLAPYLDSGRYAAKARYFHASATRGLGQHEDYVRAARALVTAHPDSPWAEEALDGLATHYILIDRDEDADEVFRETLRRFPRGRFADRAAWRSGWWAYRAGRFDEAVRLFEQGLEAFPRADYRPSWLYWSARAYEQMGRDADAVDRYRTTAADYFNSYYGRIAWARLTAMRQASLPARVAVAPDVVPELPPTGERIRTLIGIELYREALNELRYAQRVWGDTPAVQATVALVRHRLGMQTRTVERFADLRGAITLMRRAYPQFMAAGGEALPDEILRVIFPLDYWPLIEKHATAHGLDPYLMAALVSQESTFTASIRSSANAIGLMQVIPATGLRYARRLGIRPFTSARLTDPEINVRIGMTYFADLSKRFGGDHFALASYNAGENRVVRWQAERPGLPQDEFIDDIPFPETQNYVKRILGTADDYRRLYSGPGTGSR